MATVIQLAQQFGLSVALVLFFVWQGNKREKRMSDRLDSVEDFTRDKLTSVVEDNTSAMRDVTSALRNRPCLRDADLVTQEQKHGG